MVQREGQADLWAQIEELDFEIATCSKLFMICMSKTESN